MVQISEPRNDPRISHETTIMIEECDNEGYHYATMVNFSGGGIYCESDTALTPGATVNINLENRIFKSAPDSYYGEVRWCKELNGSKASHFFGIGIKVIKAGKK